MSLICNTQQEEQLASPNVHGEWSGIYARNEVHIEAAAAYFARAFGEALSLVADLELHDVRRAELRIQSIATILSNALDEYSESARMDQETGLGKHHQKLLVEAAAKVGGFDVVLREARTRGFINVTNEQITELTVALEQSYANLMDVYLREVGAIADLANLVSARPLGGDAIAWQELAWKLCSAFSRAMGLGQAIAVLNTYTLRAVPSTQP